MQTTITKVDVARALVDRALVMLLDEADYISAIVLAGSAEDVMQGLLNRERGEEGARESLVAAALKLLNPPNNPRLTSERLHRVVRGAFTWLRHADRDEPQSITVDLRFEAFDVTDRALENFIKLTGESHSRDRELYEALRALTLDD